MRCRLLQLRNLIDQQLREAPLRTLCVLGLLAVIWSAIYMLLKVVFGHIRNYGLAAPVAYEHIFVHFFLVLGVMLAFSNALLTFSTLYGRHEAAHLLAMPLNPRQVVASRWLESMLLSSWAFLLLGVPLMLAVPQQGVTSWTYYPLFLAHFVAFVAIPASLGLLAACGVALWAPRRPMAIAVAAGTLLLGLAVYWLVRLSQTAERSEEWLRLMLAQLAIARRPLLPSTWTANGVMAATRQDYSESLFYLFVVLGNAAFLAWMTVNLLAASWPLAYSRALQGRYSPVIRFGWVTWALSLPLRLVLTKRMHRVLLKDFRHFARDPKQWTQMVIMFGLLVIYVVNLKRLPFDLSQPGIKSLLTFLNLTVVSLILATFTSRFVFPMISLESQQLWLLELLPVRRTTLLLVKFCLAVSVTLLAAMLVMALAVYLLGLPPLWVGINFALSASICIGLCGLAIGLGARFPMSGQRNPARIAAGFGGTFNLIASMLFVGLEVAGVATLSVTEPLGQPVTTLPEQLTIDGWLILIGLVLAGLIVAFGALMVGAQHFRRMEA